MENAKESANEPVRQYRIGQLDDFIVRIGRTITVKGVELAVFRTSDDRIFALENKNAHRKGGPLAEGIVSGHDLYDPLYDWKINLETGKVYAPDSGQIQTYPVTVEGAEVEISLPV
ncbi:nitrite reductase small subunit NirD [Paenibacillus oenotherae]|uniref:Nitrite reductase small subunit NirD n=1 Tax=Paenibacillus oenotherae TaxID=1435645 RepID=A0ABS7D8V0_9BACL|nr:nitrite reductase small subunit NirD [Paenibacillus oenotherae]MBW7476359.1 nitrite reductase small subunit NirD [Paenibacillus oenotherae]